MIEGLSWVPRRTIFLRRMLFRASLTFSMFLMVGLVATAYVPNIWPQVVILPLALTAIFLIDDLMRWRTVRFERWKIDEGYLIYDGAEGQARTPLHEIEGVAQRLGGHVVVRLTSGQRLMMRYLPFPMETARAIEAARPADREAQAI